MNEAIAIATVILPFALVLLVYVRTRLVSRIARRRTAEIEAHNNRVMALRQYGHMITDYSLNPSFERMVLDVRKWTYGQFFESV